MLIRLGLCLAALSVGAAEPSKEFVTASRAWLDENLTGSLAALNQMPASRERDLNRAVVLLYRAEPGDHEAASRLCADLQTRNPRWTPALRCLVRADDALGRTGASTAVEALLKSQDATNRDHLWAADFFSRRADPQRARFEYRQALATEPDLYDAWRALAETETTLRQPEAAQAAQASADALFPSLPSKIVGAAEPFPTNRIFRYQAKYLFFRLATISVQSQSQTMRDLPVRVLTLDAKTNPDIFFLHINSRYQSFMSEDGGVRAHRVTSDDSATGKRQTSVDMQPAKARCVVRQSLEGLFSFDILRLPDNPQDGLSLIEVARAVARSRRSVSVLRVTGAAWKSTSVQDAGTEQIRWQGKTIDAVRVEIGLSQQAAAGISGRLKFWISADEQAILYRAQIKATVGAVTLELLPETNGGR